MKKLLLACFLLSAVVLSAQNTHSDDVPKAYPPMESKGKFLGDIAPLRDLAPSPEATDAPAPDKLWHKKNYFFSNALNNPDPLPRKGDPLVKKQQFQADNGPEIKPGLNFEGLYDGNVTPPDPSGDVGKNHYVQMVNASGGSWLRAWKKDGTPATAPIRTSTIWQQVQSSSVGDPIIQYDHAAQRWLMMEMQGGNELLIAISNDSDPTGGWKAYRVPTLGFPDYPKLYVWPNAYFITVNEIVGSNVCSGFALERDAMLAGKSEFKTYRFVMPNYLGIRYQPATGVDWEGGPPPPVGSPGYIFRIYDDAWDGGADHLQMWEVNLDWNDVSQSNITGPNKLFPAPFETRVCNGPGLFDCIEQPDAGSPRITALENIIMYRAPYRNFGTHESIVLNHVADVSGQVGDGGDAQVRWYEIRRTAGNPWQIFQQGTHAPDLATNRFMGAICTDEVGNIALGYSVCSETVQPGIRFSGRRAGDPLGTMPVQEYTLVPGALSHGSQRWGDYSSLSVDPEDGRTFWFTGEYQPTGQFWGTRIGSFRIQRDTFDISPTKLVAPQPSAVSGDETVIAEVINGGVFNTDGATSISLYFEGNLVVTDALPGNLLSSLTFLHTFSKTVNMPQPGKTYQFMVVTTWNKDQFAKNDTLRVAIRKLTTNDAAIGGKANFPGIICGTSSEVGLLIRNASGLPLTSARVRWKINNQIYQETEWTGNLAPGERDTVPLFLFNINNGQNLFSAIVDLPNGLDDQDTSNDSTAFKFFGNTAGTYLTLEAESNIGLLHWELRSSANVLLNAGEVPGGTSTLPICTSDNTCYVLSLSSSTLNWSGRVRLLDFFGKVLVEATNAGTTPAVFNFCTPPRNQVDVGAWDLVAPVSGEGLSNAEPVKIAIRNFGLNNQAGINVSYRVNGSPWINETKTGSVVQGGTVEHTFATPADVGSFGSNYIFEIRATVNGDQAPANDAKQVLVQSQYLREVSIESLTLEQGCENISNVQIALRVRNNGIETIKNLRFNYTINGGTQQTIAASVNIAPQQSFDLQNSLVVGSQNGPNLLQLFLADVNGQGSDAIASNNNASLAYTIDPLNLPLGFSIITDSKPTETTWTITDGQGQVVASGGPYADGGFFYLENECIREDTCFTLHLFDAGGDGMEGEARLFFGNKTYWMYDGGNFGSELTFDFCNRGACTGFSVTANVNDDKPTPAPDGSIVAVATGGEQPYKYAINNGAYKSLPIFTGLAAGIYVLKCKDANSCETETILVVKLQSGTGDLNTIERPLMASPNPTTSLVWLEMSALTGEDEARCEVYDNRGTRLQTVRMARWDDTLRGAVALETYPSGIYLMKVSGLKGGAVATVRVVKQ